MGDNVEPRLFLRRDRALVVHRFGRGDGRNGVANKATLPSTEIAILEHKPRMSRRDNITKVVGVTLIGGRKGGHRLQAAGHATSLWFLRRLKIVDSE